MYQEGHYGGALLAYAPVGTVVALASHAEVAIVCGLVCVGLSTLPDCDHRLPLIDHRGPTHTVPFALLVGAGLAALAAVLIDASSAFADLGFVSLAFLVGFVSIGSHLLVDALTPMGVRPFWPLSRRRYSFEITTAANPFANYGLFGLGLGAVLAGAALVVALG
ncbi:metal-dependent hydrolase [Natrinema pallidum]|uniref:Membrane-bound metal-dependent hydrolase n=2 Tax=Natrinema pallidum TaxID=69527 RepID=L9Z514_9EURY|nr:metal-dependent hydrolase [Natrinema pallidum]ELY81565.1 membrane-bound metal-dependent hydrolase [Natrinema pallidum DSM 3751]QCW02102.1 metal-dependent hydrolase [Natrinema pallidum]